MTDDEYFWGPDPPVDEYIRSRWEQATLRCPKCTKDLNAHLLVDVNYYPKGIDGVVEAMQKYHIFPVCHDCILASGMVLGKLDKVKDR